jgi:ubiquitin carboxyl-terminal hydrolase 4/11/15
MKKREGWKNSTVFTFNPEEHTIEKEIYKALENNDIEDIELLFKIIWKPAFSAEYNEGTTPIEIEKSEKLEEIFRNQRENEIINKNMMENAMEKEKESKKKNKKLKLEDLLSNFNEKEKLSKDNQWYCPKCKQFQLADKKMEIYSANEIVIIHLKRFRNNRKIENLVEFPLEGLNLKEYLPTKEDCIYDLFAVANHVGGLHGGHYFAYCKNHLDNEWYEFNDSNVDKIDQKKVVSDNAYVLFYNRRREEKINEEELFKKPYIEIDCSKYTK